jgi:hypothetical protein
MAGSRREFQKGVLRSDPPDLLGREAISRVYLVRRPKTPKNNVNFSICLLRGTENTINQKKEEIRVDFNENTPLLRVESEKRMKERRTKKQRFIA